MMSHNCSKLRLLRCIFCQIEYGVFSADDFGFQIVAAQRLVQLFDDPGNQHAALLAQELQARNDRLPRVRVELGEGQILELVLQFLHTHALGQRRVNLHRFLGDAAAFVVIVEEFQRAHVVQPVGQLDQQHADVLRHRQDQLAEVFRLLRVFRLQLDAVGFVTPSTRRATSAPNRPLMSLMVAPFSTVVQQRGNDGRGIQPDR